MARSRTRTPAWYPDERDTAVLRYWDGARWTDKRRPSPSWVPGRPLAGSPSLLLPPRDPAASTLAASTLAASTPAAPATLERDRRVRRLVRRARALALAAFTALLAAASGLGVEIQVRSHAHIPSLHDQADPDPSRRGQGPGRGHGMVGSVADLLERRAPVCRRPALRRQGAGQGRPDGQRGPVGDRRLRRGQPPARLRRRMRR